MLKGFHCVQVGWVVRMPNHPNASGSGARLLATGRMKDVFTNFKLANFIRSEKLRACRPPAAGHYCRPRQCIRNRGAAGCRTCAFCARQGISRLLFCSLASSDFQCKSNHNKLPYCSCEFRAFGALESFTGLQTGYMAIITSVTVTSCLRKSCVGIVWNV